MGNLLWALTELDQDKDKDKDSEEETYIQPNKPIHSKFIQSDGLRRMPQELLMPGPWDDDFAKHPNLKYQFTYKNYDCAVRRGGMWAWCGYVKIPENHQYHEKNFEEMEINVHGGFTGGDNEGRIGFDTCHYKDRWPVSVYDMGLHQQGHYWTYEDTVEEVKKIVDQLIETESKA